jgi:hypothetical protein
MIICSYVSGIFRIGQEKNCPADAIFISRFYEATFLLMHYKWEWIFSFLFDKEWVANKIFINSGQNNGLGSGSRFAEVVKTWIQTRLRNIQRSV